MAGHASLSGKGRDSRPVPADRRRPCTPSHITRELIRSPQRGKPAHASAWLTAVLAAITGSLLVTVAGVPAAFARPVPPPGGSYGHAPAAPVPATIIHVITTGGMAGWQITLIALAAALAAATTAVFADRARPARRGATAA